MRGILLILVLFVALPAAAQVQYFDEYKWVAKDSMEVMINGKDELLIDGQKKDISDLKQITKQFLTKSIDNESKMDSLSLIGLVPVADVVIFLMNERETKYDSYIQVQNELRLAHLELREKYAQSYFKMPFEELPKDKQKVIKKIVPFKIAE